MYKGSRLLLLLVSTATVLLGSYLYLKPSTSTKLANIFTLLDTNIEYFEQLTGPAKYLMGNTRQYDIDNCIVSVRVIEQTVREITLTQISDKCDFTPVGFNTSLNTSRTFASTMSAFPGNFYFSCIKGCGNAADPEMAYVYGGSRVENWVEQAIVSIDFYKYSAELEKSIEAEYGEDALLMGNYSLHKYTDLMKTIFAPAQIHSYSIGYDLWATAN